MKLLLGSTLTMSETAWRGLTLRYGVFFLALAIANEIVWRTQSGRGVGAVPHARHAGRLAGVLRHPGAGLLKEAGAAEAAARLAEPQE